MRKRWISLLIISLSLLACQAVTRAFTTGFPDVFQAELLTTTPTAVQETHPSLAAPEVGIQGTELPPRRTPVVPTATSTAVTPAASPARPAETLAAEVDFRVTFHPDGPLYAGDLVSVEVIAPEDARSPGLKAQVRLGEPESGDKDLAEVPAEVPAEALAEAEFARYGIAGRYQATLYWALDTADLPPGDYPVMVSILPGGPTFTETITLLPPEDVPPPEPGAHWATTTTDCCVLHYITGSAAERDLALLSQVADEQAEDISQKMEAEFAEPVSVVLLPRVLGHGGFTTEDISVAYLDRNYAGGTTQMVLHHEMVHALDNRLGGELRPTMLLEGLAVYLSGGHFKPEPLMPRAAALLYLDWYLPLPSLADNFYPSQHEVGYLEAGALVEYMVERWGWEGFSAFYRDIHPIPNHGSQSRAIDRALQAHFGLSLDELEDAFLQELRREPVTDEQRLDVQLTVKQYDLVRSYQLLLDPSAYFMTAWLPDVKQMRQRGIVADYLRHPESLENMVVETLLGSADAALRQGEYWQAERRLEAVEEMLAAVQVGAADPAGADPLSAAHADLVRLLLGQSCEPQRLTVGENTARAWCAPMEATTSGLGLVELELVRGEQGWVLADQSRAGQ